MGKWADLARQMGETEPRANRANSVDSPPFGTNDAIGTASLFVPPSEPKVCTTLRNWHRHLSALNFDQAPAGFDLRRWRQLCEDAWWLFEGFGSQLVREGWSSHDVFGVLPWRPGGGVLLDRLQGARNLKLDGGKAFWSWPYSSVVMRTSRGVGDRLVSSGLVLVWELGY